MGARAVNSASALEAAAAVAAAAMPASKGSSVRSSSEPLGERELVRTRWSLR